MNALVEDHNKSEGYARRIGGSCNAKGYEGERHRAL